MVSMVVNNSGNLHFRVLWKFPNMPATRGEWYCSSLSELSRILWHSEGISKDTVDFIFVHQIGTNDVTLEIIAYDRLQTSANKNEHILQTSSEAVRTAVITSKASEVVEKAKEYVYAGFIYRATKAPSSSSRITN